MRVTRQLSPAGGAKRSGRPWVWGVVGAALVALLSMSAGNAAVAAETGAVAVEIVSEPDAMSIALDIENDTLAPLDVTVAIGDEEAELTATPFGSATTLAAADLPATIVITGAAGTDLRVIATYFDASGATLSAAVATTRLAADGGSTPTTPEPSPTVTLEPTPEPAPATAGGPSGVVADTGGVPAWWLVGAGALALAAGAILTLIVRKRVDA
ncbi:hypothetical protein [Microbacterium aquimaris]|uniref:LPXTG cell wall anchor domain-containing protein n=1 Tax=Microbacterium aquimaris TaxID=459816 RepID=A0ABU5N5S4_9MICO|nr:hypothetical protein [Microbacterium aquimaris]MDZ8161262.1 hypothetical protein [Microbacterium aquimaris]